MNSLTSPRNILEKRAYDIQTLDDEIRIDSCCEELLRQCYLFLVENYALGPEEASGLCYGASYFLREYLIPDRRINLFDLDHQHIRQFAGNWYIIKNMEPNLVELTTILEGVMAFYQYSHRQDLISADQLETVRLGCADLDYYRHRIETFWAIENDGYLQWDADCPLTKPNLNRSAEGAGAKLDP